MIETTIIVGGGIAGPVAAAMLARHGERPLLLERSRGPHHKVCGEFLSWEAAGRLAALGFDVASLGGSRIDRVRLIADASLAEAALPGVATGISRYRLDEALIAHAGRLGAHVERGVAVQSVSKTDGLTVDGIRTRRVLVATGKHNLRGLPRATADQPVADHYVGYKAHFRLRTVATAALAGAVELHLLPGGGYAGLQLVEDGIANLCLLAPKGARWDDVRQAIDRGATLLADRLGGAAMLFDKPLAIAGVPYGFVHRGVDAEGIGRIGDQFAVVHSFTGDGMAMAVATAMLAAEGAADGQLRAAVRRPVRLSAAMHGAIARPVLHAPIIAAARAFPAVLTQAARLTRSR